MLQLIDWSRTNCLHFKSQHSLFYHQTLPGRSFQGRFYYEQNVKVVSQLKNNSPVFQIEELIFKIYKLTTSLPVDRILPRDFPFNFPVLLSGEGVT